MAMRPPIFAALMLEIKLLHAVASIETVAHALQAGKRQPKLIMLASHRRSRRADEET